MEDETLKYSPLLFPYSQLDAHISTLHPYFFRKVEKVHYQRERIETPDGDFLDLDWAKRGHRKLIILSHGLEGSSQGKYIRGMIHYLGQKGFDGLAWNCRSCSGVPNRKRRFYHSGDTQDFDLVIQHALKQGAYEEIYLAGFSMGGNITLKYLGEQGPQTPSALKGAVVFSVPVMLRESCQQLSKGLSKLYGQNFLFSLKRKIWQKKDLLDDFDFKDIKKIKTLKDFDNELTAPLHGFLSGDDYYEKSSSRQFLPTIQVPTLLVNAQNDPFLGSNCYPFDEAKQNPFLTFEAPEKGGHVGFCFDSGRGSYWTERRALAFLKGIV